MSHQAVPGVLMRFLNFNGQGKPLTSQFLSLICPGICKTYNLTADDAEKPSYMSLHVLDDITTLINSSDFFELDKAAKTDWTVSWIVCEFINGRDKGSPPTDSPETFNPLKHEPIPGSKLVINGSTPRPDKESDYHTWYNEEHGPGLSIVPGWNAARRYSLKKSYGEIETANFYGFNYYDEESGLGGPIWQKSTKTEWSSRIRSNAAKPNIRRVWRIQSSSQ
ncbi:hypothetical protein HJFPF1_10487 [Paramyrothecium foliicola]|nr:hypothetical protein HJFPF1_10487 [Paramyrothecium foliicola]